jgi:hypothetical protein
LLTIYSLESFVYEVFNQTLRKGDRAKIDSLGPYAQAMNYIIKEAIANRGDELDENHFSDLKLYRASALREEKIKIFE